MDRVRDHEELQELLGAYALDAVDPDEVEVIERHLEVCPRCRAEVAEHREVTGLLGYVGYEAPPGVWDRISASLQEPPPVMRLARVDTPPAVTSIDSARRRRSLGMRSLAAFAAVAAAVVAVLGIEVGRLNHRTNTLSHQLASVASPSMLTVQSALAAPGARKVQLHPFSAGSASTTSLDAVILPDGTGYLYDSNLTPLPGSETYQLWGVTGTKQVSYGLLGADPGVEPFRASPTVQALAVTAEVSGGVQVTSKPIVAVGSVSPPV